MVRGNSKKYHSFKQLVKNYYRTHKRALPWRETTDPYAILVSEVMLQQTQVDRVIPKYEQWLQRFPTVEVLAQASLQQVLTVWQGLGYNRRGLALQRAAQKMVADFNAIVPTSIDDLLLLPGIGPYTAAAVATFAFNQAHVMIETNIRTVYIHHFFPDEERVSDTQLRPLIEATLDRQNPREWYWALMDYGSALKKLHSNPSRQSKHYKKQSSFKGSNRLIRGFIIKRLTEQSPLAVSRLAKELNEEPDKVEGIVQQLKKEGLLSGTTQKIWLH